MIKMMNKKLPSTNILLILFGIIGVVAFLITSDSKEIASLSETKQNGMNTKAASTTRVVPTVLPTDQIYKNARTVYVIPEYKLIFFTFPKVACSEWKRMFMRMNDNPLWCKIRGISVHDPEISNLSILSDYSPEVATAMMTSPAWTRAAIVREPKERVLSAFLDKAVKETYYNRKCCQKIPDETDRKLCIKNRKEFKSFLHFVSKYPELCFDVHWEPQAVKIDSKWWPYVDFIGHQSNLLDDSKQILKSITSSRDSIPGRNAWDRYGVDGWGNDNELCELRPKSFLEENTSAHNLDTGHHLLEWYTPETEKMVEETWAVEWQIETVEFPKVVLFPDEK